MEPVLYFYSTDGTATFGPVTEDALRLLFKDQVIGPASFICPQGEAEWKPLDTEWLRRAPLPMPRLPRYEPPPYVPTGQAKDRENERVLQLVEKFDEGPQPELFKWGGVVFAALVTIVLALMRDGIPNIVAGVIGGVLVTGLLPYIVSQYVKVAWRLRMRTIAMVVFTVLTFAGQSLFNECSRLVAVMSRVPVMPIASSPAPVVPVAKPTPVIDDPALIARMTQAAQLVQQEMIDKVKASDAAEKACGSFDPATITTQDALSTLRDGIKKFRAAQSDVLAYFQTFDDRCRTALATGQFTADQIERFVADVHQSGRIDQAVAFWVVRIKLTDDHLARLDFLDKHWGSWQSKDGQVLFANQADLDAYDALTKNLAPISSAVTTCRTRPRRSSFLGLLKSNYF